MHINVSTLIDVAIGLIFIFFVFSTFISGIVELINSLFEQRTRLLRIALNKLLGSLANDFFKHQLTSVKEQNFFGFLKPISYLSADSFSTVLIDLLVKPAVPAPDGTSSTKQTFEQLKQVLLQPGHTEIKELIRPMLAKSDDLLTFKAELEKWYNGYMEQVSGWFKRYAQAVVRIVAIVITLAMNVDTIYLANQLFNDNGLRERLVTEAIHTTETAGKSFGKDTTFGKYLHENNSKLVRADSADTNAFIVRSDLTGVDSLAVQAAYVRFVQSHIDELKLPIGWEMQQGKSPWQPGQTVGLALLGWLLTAAALSFGAPFWFDLLLKLVNIRNTARRPAGNPSPAT